MKTRKNLNVWLAMGISLLMITAATTAGEICVDTSIRVITDTNADKPLVTTDSVQVEVIRGKGAEAVLICNEVQWLNRTGEPQIPWRVLTVVLPPDVDLSSVSAAMDGEFEPIEDKWLVKPTPPSMTYDGEKTVVLWPEDKNIDDYGRDKDIYEHDTFWPEGKIKMLGIGQLRKWRLAQIAVPLVRYNAVRSELVLLTDAEVTITFNRTAPATPRLEAAEMSDRIGESSVRRIAVNFEQARSAYEPDVEGGMRTLDEGEPNRGYVIITTSAIESSSTKLVDFVAHKESIGFDVQVITELDFGGGTGDTAAENIRAWLQGHYISDNIEYVLLIGNPHPDDSNVPMKMLLSNPLRYDYPSDLYYADLTGNWDLDSDAHYGEWEDDFGTGGVDRFWEVLVGRIPYYGSPNDLDAILDKTINYESQTESAAWHKNVLLPMEPLDESTLSYNLGEAIKNDILIPNEWLYHRIYDEDYGLVPPPETTPCTYDNVTEVWDGNATNSEGKYGLVVWSTHGSATLASDVMDISHVADLNDTYPSFTFQGSCNNSTPETTNNLAYEILKNGGISTIGATRESTYTQGQTLFRGTTSNQGMCYEYTRRIVKGLTCGYALSNLKQALMPGGAASWMNFTAFNVYGDPALRIVPASLPMPSVIYVDTKAAPGGKGLNWETAFNNLQDALAKAYSYIWDISEIKVAQGVYMPDTNSSQPNGTGDREATFKLINNVILKGGYAGFGTPDPNARDINLYKTIINGDIGIKQEPNDNSYHVVSGDRVDETAVLDGFTITSGNANGPGDHNDGGGLYVGPYSRPTISNCNFRDNSAGRNGGGVFNDSYSQSNLMNCVFIGNSSERGGGMCNSSYNRPTLSNCIFSDNSATSTGGGIYNEQGSRPELLQCVFIDNNAKYGGGISNGYENETTLRNCIFTGNTARYGGGIRNSFFSNQLLVNCTFVNNSAMYGSGMYNQKSDHILMNCIFWNLGSEIYNSNSTVTAFYSDIQGGWPGTGNIDVDPCFANSDVNDFHLKSQAGRWDPNSESWVTDVYTSPCIDAGNPGCPLGEEPNDANNIRINMGAYGGTAEASMAPYGWALLPDLTNDGTVNLEDFAGQANDWRESENKQPGDLNRDGIVDIFDFALLREDWLEETVWY